MKSFAVKLTSDQMYMEKSLSEIINKSPKESTVVDVFSDLMTVTVSALLLNSPPGAEEEIKQHLILFIEGWRKQEHVDH